MAWRSPETDGAEGDVAYSEFAAFDPLTPAISPEEKRRASLPGEVKPASREWLVGAPTEPSV